MFVPLYFGLVVLGNGVEPFFSARKADVLSDKRTEQTAGFFSSGLMQITGTGLR